MMNGKQRARGITSLAIASLILLSFRAYAPSFTPSLTSDNAVHILMAASFRGPEDLYFWGQDRLGSLVPLLAHWVLQILPIDPVTAVSGVQYGLLLVGFLCFAQLLRSAWAQLALALIWFLPLIKFSQLVRVGQPYGAQMACIGIGVFLLHRFRQQSPPLYSPQRYLLLAAATASLLIAFWVSDFTIITLGVMAVMGLIEAVRIGGDRSLAGRHKLARMGLDGLTVGTTAAVGVSFISYAKHHAIERSRYTTLSTPTQIQTVMARLGDSLIQAVTFQGDHPLVSVQVWLVLIFGLYSIRLFWIDRHRLVRALSPWFYVFAISALLGIGALCVLEWIYRNPNLRYFTPIYVYGWLTALLFAETIDRERRSQALSLPAPAPVPPPRSPILAGRSIRLLLVSLALCTSLTSPSYTFAFQPAPPTVVTLADLQTLGQAGLIGDYWTAYLSCVVDPDQLACTPYDRRGAVPCRAVADRPKRTGRVRCDQCVKDVLESGNIYLIQDLWFDQFPPEIEQFGHCLRQTGQPQSLGGLTLAPYQLID